MGQPTVCREARAPGAQGSDEDTAVRKRRCRSISKVLEHRKCVNHAEVAAHLSDISCIIYGRMNVEANIRVRSSSKRRACKPAGLVGSCWALISPLEEGLHLCPF